MKISPRSAYAFISISFVAIYSRGDRYDITGNFYDGQEVVIIL